MEFPEKAEDKLNIAVILIVGLASVFLTYGAIIAFQALFRADSEKHFDQRYHEGAGNLLNQVEETQGTLLKSDNRAQKRLSIEKAKSKIVSKLNEARRTGNPSLQTMLVPSVGASTDENYDPRYPGIPVPLDKSGASAPPAPAPAPGPGTDAADGANTASTPTAATPSTPATPAAAATPEATPASTSAEEAAPAATGTGN